MHKEDIVNNILSLDTRFGLLTFDKPFAPNAPEVGRIGDITPGTYENACTYVHAGTFGVEPTMDSVKIMPSSYFPARNARMKLTVGGKVITVKYENRGYGRRQILLNGESLELQLDELRNAYGAVISKINIKENDNILIID